MAEKSNATCSICGKRYHKCLSCKDKMRVEPWKMYTCSSAHYQVYQVLRGYNTGMYTKEEAKSKLQNIDLSDLNNFQESKQKIIKEIMKEDKKIAKTVEPIVEEATEDVVETVEVSNAEPSDESVSETQTPTYAGRRKRVFEQEGSE